MNDDARKMPPEKVNIDSCQLDDEELSQAAGGNTEGDTGLIWCRKCKKITPNTYFFGKGWVCDVCGDDGGFMVVTSAPRNRHNA